MLFASPESLVQKARERRLADAPEWRRLLHYRRPLLGGTRSEIDDPHFFISPTGRWDAAAELDATLEAFFKPLPPGPGVEHPQCRYPARYAWLKETLDWGAEGPAAADCPRYEKWRTHMDAASITLVFASSYMNNPASMYGHTFLRLNGRSRDASTRLLDYVVNFAADVESESGMLFAVKGLLGGYGGRFSTMPYYMKVQEYNNLEARDLWEYDLRLPPEGIERFLRHLWELGMSRMPYFFLNKNCSYYLLPAMEVMDWSWRLKDEFIFKAIPADTVRAILRRPGVLAGASRRPSHVSRMIRARQRLVPQEIRLAERAARGPERISPEEWKASPAARRALVLDSALDLFRFQVGFHRDQAKDAQEKERALLLLRNQAASESAPPAEPGVSLVKTEPAYPPHLGHKTGRIGLSYGFSNRSRFEELSLRPAMHDPLDPPKGYLPGNRMEMFHLKLRYDHRRRRLYPQRFAVVDLMSLTPWDRWVHPPSWKLNTGLETADDLDRDPEHALMYGLHAGSGYAARLPVPGRPLLYGLAEMDFGLSPAFRHSVRWGGGPSGGILWECTKAWRLHVEASYAVYAVGTAAAARLSAFQTVDLGRDVGFRAGVSRQNRYKDVLIGLVVFL